MIIQVRFGGKVEEAKFTLEGQVKGVKLVNVHVDFVAGKFAIRVDLTTVTAVLELN